MFKSRRGFRTVLDNSPFLRLCRLMSGGAPVPMEMLPPPLEGGGLGGGVHIRLPWMYAPLPPTPSLKGRGEFGMVPRIAGQLSIPGVQS